VILYGTNKYFSLKQSSYLKIARRRALFALRALGSATYVNAWLSLAQSEHRIISRNIQVIYLFNNTHPEWTDLARAI